MMEQDTTNDSSDNERSMLASPAFWFGGAFSLGVWILLGLALSHIPRLTYQQRLTYAQGTIILLSLALLAVSVLCWSMRRSFIERGEELQRRFNEAFADPLLTGINIGNGSIDVGMEGPGPMLLAGTFLGMFEKYPEAKNYIECHLTSARGDLIVTVRRREGKTPDALKREAEQKLATMTAKVERFAELLRSIGDLAHDKSTGPVVHDTLWDIRHMAYEGLREVEA